MIAQRLRKVSSELFDQVFKFKLPAVQHHLLIENVVGRP